MKFCNLWLCTDQLGLLGNTECIVHSNYSLTPCIATNSSKKKKKKKKKTTKPITVINYDNRVKSDDKCEMEVVILKEKSSI